MQEVAEIHGFPAEPPIGQRDDEAVASRRKWEEILLKSVSTHLISSEYAELLVPALHPRVPDKLLLGSLRDGRLRVKVPIVVKCSTEDQDVIVEGEELNEFGFGKNLSEALSDLQAVIVELYFTLEREQDRLGLDLRRTWATLQEKISRRP